MQQMVTLSRNAEIALKSLPPEEQSQVLMVLDHLDESGHLANQHLIERLKLEDETAYDAVYLMRVAHHLRVIFAVEDQQFEPRKIIVLDVFDRDRLKTMHEVLNR